jgi:hypothetical protein
MSYIDEYIDNLNHSIHINSNNHTESASMDRRRDEAHKYKFQK